MKIQEIIERLGLKPHPEGGFYKETYRSEENISVQGLPSRYKSTRNMSTTIYFLITQESCSLLHRISTDEIFHFYLGDPVMMLQLYPGGYGKKIILGNEIFSGHVPQCIVPRDVWQGLFIINDGSFALMGTTLSPGFDFQDFELGNRQELLEKYQEIDSCMQVLSASNISGDE